MKYSVHRYADAHKEKKSCPFGAALFAGSVVLDIVALLEAVNTSGRVNELLLAGVKGMASRANFNVDIFRGRTGLNNISTRAGDFGIVVRGVYTFCHTILQHCLPVICIVLPVISPLRRSRYSWT